jgi:hypothetical protein
MKKNPWKKIVTEKKDMPGERSNQTGGEPWKKHCWVLEH